MLRSLGIGVGIGIETGRPFSGPIPIPIPIPTPMIPPFSDTVTRHPSERNSENSYKGIIFASQHGVAQTIRIVDVWSFLINYPKRVSRVSGEPPAR
ncbi:hypothetical protein D3OALGA1CA_3449 [Olavius algarvensis associated proteobacterium Delta 3]|nr:hypothetical protein D3OALGB2SA_3853 [Olavius algarvensis associated proteobacterium Delta 3]CAB5134598.1 hypothetical protein D3OALGA1CA_3449 [Olavius algarvensis associated proteobacterium Delta 3]